MQPFSLGIFTGTFGTVSFADRFSAVYKINDKEDLTSIRSGVHGIIRTYCKKIPEFDKQKRIYYYKIALKHAEYTLEHGSLTEYNFQDNKQFRLLVMESRNCLLFVNPPEYQCGGWFYQCAAKRIGISNIISMNA